MSAKRKDFFGKDKRGILDYFVQKRFKKCKNVSGLAKYVMEKKLLLNKYRDVPQYQTAEASLRSGTMAITLDHIL